VGCDKCLLPIFEQDLGDVYVYLGEWGAEFVLTGLSY